MSKRDQTRQEGRLARTPWIFRKVETSDRADQGGRRTFCSPRLTATDCLLWWLPWPVAITVLPVANHTDGIDVILRPRGCRCVLLSIESAPCHWVGVLRIAFLPLPFCFYWAANPIDLPT